MKVEQAHNNVQWKKVKLGEVCVPSSEKYNPLTENLFQYCIEMENINQESGTLNGKSDIAKLLSLKTKFHKGEVLYGKLRPYLRKYWLADFDGACSTEIWVLKNAENIDNRFLFYLFQSESINKIANLSSGTKMPRADWRFMEKQTVSIPFKNNKPDLSAQRRIAAILASADKVIAATQKTIAKYKQMKQGMMEDLLKPKGGWKMVRLGDVGEINPSNKEPIPNQFIYIDLESVVAGKLLFENYILKGNAPSRAQRLVDKNDVLYQTVRPYQRNNYIHKKQGNYVASTGYALIRCYDDYEPDFIFYLLHTHNFESVVLGLCTGTSYPAIAPNNLKRIEIAIPFKNDKPDLIKQRRMAAILLGIDAKIAAEEKVLEKYEKVKKGMMERMMEE